MTIARNRLPSWVMLAVPGWPNRIFTGVLRRVRIRYLQFDYHPPAQLNGAQIAVLDFKIGAMST
jgi:hypothetical protein